MIGYIPARSGSKRIPGKNLKCLDSYSLVELAIVRAYQSGLNPIYVSSDSKYLLDKINIKYSFIPLLRDPLFSLDETTISSSLVSDLDPIIHQKFAPICILQPSNPFCTVESLRQSAHIYCSSDYPSLVSGYCLPYRHYEISTYNDFLEHNSIVPYTSIPEFKSFVFIDGNFAFSTLNHCTTFSSVWKSKDSIVFLQQNKFVIDIDEPDQLAIARACWPTWLSMHNQAHFYS